MSGRTPLELLFDAVLSGGSVCMTLHGLAVPVELVVRRRRITRLSGVIELMEGIQGGVPEGVELRGELKADVERLVEAGRPIGAVMDAAALGVGRFLAGLCDRPDVFAFLSPVGPPRDELPLPLPALRVVAWGLADQRNPDQVADRMRDRWESRLTTTGVALSQLPDLDPVALRTLKAARGARTLGELVVRSGRLQPDRTRRAWLSIDLLIQLGLVRVDAEPGEEPLLAPTAEPSAAPVPQVQAQELADAVEAARPAAADDDVLEMADLCSSLSPLSLLRLDAGALAQVLTLRGMHKELWLEYARYHPRHFVDSDDEVREAAADLERLMRSNREALRDPTFVALRVRQLRSFSEPVPKASPLARRKALRLFRGAQGSIMLKDWRGALEQIQRARRHDLGSHRFMLMEVFCRVALRELSAADGLLNIDSLWLEDTVEQALAHHLAGRILRASGKGEQADRRFKQAQVLEPSKGAPEAVETEDLDDDPSVVEVFIDDNGRSSLSELYHQTPDREEPVLPSHDGVEPPLVVDEDSVFAFGAADDDSEEIDPFHDDSSAGAAEHEYDLFADSGFAMMPADEHTPPPPSEERGMVSIEFEEEPDSEVADGFDFELPDDDVSAIALLGDEE